MVLIVEEKTTMEKLRLKCVTRTRVKISVSFRLQKIENRAIRITKIFIRWRKRRFPRKRRDASCTDAASQTHENRLLPLVVINLWCKLSI